MPLPTKGTIVSADTDAIVIEAEKNTTTIILDYIDGDDVWFAFDQEATFEEGFRLGALRPALVLDQRSYGLERDLHCISDTGLSGRVAWHKFRS